MGTLQARTSEPIHTKISLRERIHVRRTVQDVRHYPQGQKVTPQGHVVNPPMSYSSALRNAVIHNRVKSCQLLLEGHLEASLPPSVCCPLLLMAVRTSNLRIAQLLCHHGGRWKSHRKYIDIPGCAAMECSRTALHLAVSLGNVAMTRLLIHFGADAHVRDDFGYTPFHHLIFTLQPHQVTLRNFACAFELLKCEMSISAEELNALHEMYMSSISSMDNRLVDLTLVPDFTLDLRPGPFQLQHLCRVKIRETIGYPRLPQAYDDLPLPDVMKLYLLS